MPWHQPVVGKFPSKHDYHDHIGVLKEEEEELKLVAIKSSIKLASDFFLKIEKSFLLN